MSDVNPYAPPEAGPTDFLPATASATILDQDLEAIRQELDAYLADPSNVASERELGKIKSKAALVVLGVVGALFLVGGVIVGATGDSSAVAAAAILGVVGVLFVVIVAVALVRLGKLQSPESRATPVTAVQSYYRAISLRASGAAVTMLAPRARQTVVSAPVIPPVVTGPGSFTLGSDAQMTAYAQTVATLGHGQVRRMRLKSATLIEEHGGIAKVACEVEILSWPRWANIVSVVAFVVIRVVGIVAYLVLWFALKKQVRLTVTKSLVRAASGSWYLASGSVIE
ncbi:MAG: hypothetical protein U0169_17705 [Polyangiaceae bacterium]